MPTNWTPQTANPPSQAQDVCIPTGTPNAPVIGPAPPPFTEATARTISSAELIDVQTGGILHLFNGTEESIFQDGITLGDSTTLNAAGPLTVHGDFAWNGNNATIKGGTGAARKITIASDGTLTEAAGPASSASSTPAPCASRAARRSRATPTATSTRPASRTAPTSRSAGPPVPAPWTCRTTS